MTAIRRPRSSTALLPVVKASGSCLYLADGARRAVLECPTLAFGIKGEVEQRAVIQGWADLLNSLPHPLQILIRTRAISSVKDHTCPDQPDVEARLRESYTRLLGSLAQRRLLVDRHFYVVVPWQPAPGSSVTSWLKRSPSRVRTADSPELLEQRVAWVGDSLRRIDLEPVRLSSRELTGILYQTLCPGNASIQPLPPEDDLDELADLVAPAALEERPFDLSLDGRLARTLAVSRYPSRLRPGWIESLLAVEGDLDVSIHIQPAPGPVVMSFLERRVAELSSTVRVAEEKGRRPDPFRRAALEDAMELQDGLARGEERLFDVSVYLAVWAESHETLESLTGRVEAVLGSQLIHSRRLLFQMEPALLSSLPLGLDQVGLRRSLSTSALSATFPFTGNDLRAERGFLYGVNPSARTPVVVNRFALENHNSVVFATSGAGKSYLVKVELLRAHVAGIRAQVIDPEGEYAGIVEELGGSVVRVRPGEPLAIDPFAVNPGPGALEARVANLLTLLDLLSGGLSAIQRAAAEDALSFLYAAHGYLDDVESPGLTPPGMAELQQVLERRAGEARNGPGEELAQLALKLRRYASGAGSWLLKSCDAPSSADSHCYVLAGLPEEDRAAAMFIVLDRLWSFLSTNTEPTLIVVDEGWLLMQYPDTARFLFRLAKTARKRRAGLTLVTQDVADILSHPLGEATVTNSALQILMKQAPQSIEGLTQLFRLTGAEQSWLLNARPGEGLILAQGKRVPFRVAASEEEARLIAAAELRRRTA